MKICIITDDKKFHRMLELELTELGFEVIGEDAREAHLGCPVLCDLDYCGLDKVRALSQSSELFGWTKNNPENIPSGQLCSCLFTRPFLVSELRSALEKFTDGEQSIKKQKPKQKRVSELGRRKNILTCNYPKREAVFGSHIIPLSPAEAEVLRLLCERRGEIVTRDELSMLFGQPEGNISDVYICKLRSKIDNTLGIKFIYTVKGKGYTLK